MRIHTALIVVVAMLAASSTSAIAATAAPEADAVAVAQANEAANIDAFIAEDLAALMATFTEDAVFEDQTFGDDLKGARAIEAMNRVIFWFTDAEATELLDHFVSSDGSRAVQIFQWVGTSDRGRPFDLPVVVVNEYRDGKIVKQSLYYAARDAWAQLKEPPPAE